VIKQVRIIGRRPVLGTVALHDPRDARHLLGCAKCQGNLVYTPQPQGYTLPFWDGVEAEEAKWDRYRS
jgi:hypothetical protein